MIRIFRPFLLCCFPAAVLFALAGDPRADARQGAPVDEAGRHCTFRVESGGVVMQPVARLPVVMHLAPDLPRAIRDIAIEAMKRWNRGWAAYLMAGYAGDPFGTGNTDVGAVSLRLFGWRSSEIRLAAADDGVNVIVLSDGAPARRMASTPISWNSRPRVSASPGDRHIRSPITDADIEIYMHRRPRVNYGDGPPGRREIDALSVMAHELGHVLGLGHLDAGEDTVMTFPLREGVRVLPSARDYDNLMCVYAAGLRHRYGDGGPVR
ncbi:MAG: matrixin family metalloprotease [Defluviicoccus sp.]|nr:matrixin family metalloprotease [Defluviicoccus sp.]